MKFFSTKIFPLLVGALLLFGCYAQQPVQPFSNFTPTQFDSDRYASSINNFLIILDASSSMGNTYNGNNKFVVAREVVNRINQTLPELAQNSGLRSFGHSKAVSDKATVLFYGMETYSTNALREKLKMISSVGGTSHMYKALAEAGQDLKGVSGKTAVLIISDGQEENGLASPVTLTAAQAMKDQLGSQLCFYTILVGDDAKGVVLMEEISQIGMCGFSTNGDKLLAGDGIVQFVKDVFLTQKKMPPMAPKDNDNDGVTDDMDKCPESPEGAVVNADGCPIVPQKAAPSITDALNAQGAWVVDEAFFGFDKSAVTPGAFDFLDQIAKFLKLNPEVFVKIQGHTDNVGTKAYNDALAMKRAQAVKTYLTGKGIEKNRLTCEGFGFSKPAASNKTDKGRALNRRVEIYPYK